ncbi:DNA polymerase Y family protein (plasmid) [Streptomyces sp. SDT5-1]|uniref:DNA polymerase Y family protein n=1 Tax=Streptomyces sp. SDT5-1 TaxID=3406418 RepID=UPI003FD3E4E6
MTAPTPPAAGGARPDRSVLRIRFDLTGHQEPDKAFELLLGLVEDITPIHQPLPTDHSVDLDISGALRHFDRTPYELASILQLRAIALYGAPCAVGGGRSPMIAAMAAALTPHGRITVVAPDDAAVERFLRPQPLTALPGIGSRTAQVLNRYGVTNIGQLADAPSSALSRILGAHAARELSARAAGHDPRPVQRTALVRSTSAQAFFPRDELDPQAHRAALLGLADELGSRLRANGEVCRGVTLAIRYADRSESTRSRQLPEPSQHTPAVNALATALYETLGLQRARVRAIVLRADALAPDTQTHHQMLFDNGTDERARRLEAVTDLARARFGAHVVRPASTAPRPKEPR